jgi:sugar lactone lactonase YvrE
MQVQPTVGRGNYTYRVDKAWGRRASGVPTFGVSQGVTGDSQDRIYIFQRSPTAEVLVFDREGTLLTRWGNGQFVTPHGIWMSPQDELYLTDTDDHTVTQWTTAGKLVRRWGSPRTPGPVGQPFNQPTKAVLAADGEMYVADGYGQQRVHRFDRAGNLLHSWGEPGTGPGQFVLPHDVWVDERDRVLVCDRENRRVEIFDRAGSYLGEWADVQNPMQVFGRDGVLYLAHAYAEISLRTLDGEVLARWPWESTVTAAAEMSPHSLWVDSRGDIYVGEVVGENGFQKFVRQ